MRLSRLVAVAVSCLVAFASMGRAQQSDSAAVATAQRLLDALAAHDTTALRDVMLPGTRIQIVGNDTNAFVPRAQSDTGMRRSIAASTERLLERMWSPTVHVNGNLAVVWAPYDFHVDGRFSHCGVDVFTMARTPAGWRVMALEYTVQRLGCAPSPLGPPT